MELNGLLLTFSGIKIGLGVKIENIKNEKKYADWPTGHFWELENDANQTFYRWSKREGKKGNRYIIGSSPKEGV